MGDLEVQPPRTRNNVYSNHQRHSNLSGKDPSPEKPSPFGEMKVDHSHHTAFHHHERHEIIHKTHHDHHL